MTLGVVTEGTVPAGVVTDGVVTLGTVTLGVVTDGTVATGVVTLGTVTAGVDTPGTLTFGSVAALPASGTTRAAAAAAPVTILHDWRIPLERRSMRKLALFRPTLTLGTIRRWRP